MQELILIGAIALIVLGPRKLPQVMRTAGKMMAEFRKATNDFKETWEREVDFEEFKNIDGDDLKPVSTTQKTIAHESESKQLQIAAPEIKEVKQEDVEKMLAARETKTEIPEPTARAVTGKQDWL